MNLHWTFTSLENDWVHESYSTKEEAITEGKLLYEGSFLIGQLIEKDEDLVYSVENIEEIIN